MFIFWKKPILKCQEFVISGINQSPTFRSLCRDGSSHMYRIVTTRSGKYDPDSVTQASKPDGLVVASSSLITMYQHIYDGIHAKSGRVAPLKQYYVRTEFEACMGWVSAFLLETIRFSGPRLTTAAKYIIAFFHAEHHFLRAVLDAIAGDT